MSRESESSFVALLRSSVGWTIAIVLYCVLSCPVLLTAIGVIAALLGLLWVLLLAVGISVLAIWIVIVLIEIFRVVL